MSDELTSVLLAISEAWWPLRLKRAAKTRETGGQFRPGTGWRIQSGMTWRIQRNAQTTVEPQKANENSIASVMTRKVQTNQ